MSADINIEIKDIPAKIMPVLAVLKRYLAMIFLIFFVSIYTFLTLRTNSLMSSKPSEEAVLEKLKTVQRPRIDEKAAEKILQLEDQSIQVKTLFKEARENPFAE
jgi:hypothetical protein